MAASKRSLSGGGYAGCVLRDAKEYQIDRQPPVTRPLGQPVPERVRHSLVRSNVSNERYMQLRHPCDLSFRELKVIVHLVQRKC